MSVYILTLFLSPIISLMHVYSYAIIHLTDRFISIASLLDPSNGFIVDDTVIFKVEITVYGELEAAFPVVSINEGGPQTLARNLKVKQKIINQKSEFFSHHIYDFQ